MFNIIFDIQNVFEKERYFHKRCLSNLHSTNNKSIVRNYVSEEINFIKGNVNDINDNTIGYVLSDYEVLKVQNIKEKHPWICTMFVTNNLSKHDNIDILFPYITYNETEDKFLDLFYINAKRYYEESKKIKSLITPQQKTIQIKKYTYNPNTRCLYYNNKEILKFTQKQGEIFETLALNFKKPVSKKVILQKTWGNIDYFSDRSMDVYLSNLRKIFREKKVNLNIRNVKGMGIILN